MKTKNLIESKQLFNAFMQNIENDIRDVIMSKGGTIVIDESYDEIPYVCDYVCDCDPNERIIEFQITKLTCENNELKIYSNEHELSFDDLSLTTINNLMIIINNH